jgi:hypothetical protein
LTGLPLTTGVTGTLPVANGGTNLTSFTANGVVYASSTSALATGSALVFDGTNVGIGTSAPVSTLGRSLHLYNDANTGTVASNTYFAVESLYRNANIELSGSSAATNAVSFSDVLGTTVAGIASSIADSNLFFRTGGTTERMRIDSSGNVGIGTSSPSGRLEVSSANNIIYSTGTGGFGSFYARGSGTNEAYIFMGNATSGEQGRITVQNGGVIAFANTVSATERMRIDASGNLLVGTTSLQSGERLAVRRDATDMAFSVDNEAGSGSQTIRSKLATGANNTSSYHFIGTTGALGTDKIFIYGNGNIVNTNNSYGTLSDVKLKENIVDATPKLSDVMLLKVRNFNLKSDSDQKQIGFVAQELEQVFPAMIDESPDLDAKGNALETVTKSIKTSVLIPILVKAIQEQQALIESLTTRLTALEQK